MKKQDRDLGMDRPISRRDFVNGVAVAAGATVALGQAGAALAQAPIASAAGGVSPANYPPLRTGARGHYPGVYAPAHALRDGGKAPEGEDTGETYDLVVVGGGLSGIGAAWYYREAAGPSAKILIIDNLDDFGGHAKRNEFVVGGKMFVSAGGSVRLPAPEQWTRDSKRLLEAVGVADLHDPRDHTDHKLYPSLGMGPATFFDKAHFGKDVLVKGGTLRRPNAEFLAKAPLSPKVKEDLARLTSNPKIDYMPGLSIEEKIAKLRTTSYRDYLLNYVKIGPETVELVEGPWCLSPDTASAWYAMFRHSPGFAGLGVPVSTDSPEEPARQETNYYIPGGNHSVCRLILRQLIPGCMPAGDWVQVESERFNYQVLDKPGNATRIRLNSTVVRAKHIGAAPALFAPDDRMVEVTYVREGKALKVKAKDVVMAGMNNVIPYICPEIADPQKAAMRKALRSINVTCNVVLRNWEAFHKLGVSSISCPGGFVDSIALNAPRTFGALQPSTDPSQPILASFNVTEGLTNRAFYEEIMHGHPPYGAPMEAQIRAARAGLYQLPFERFEQAIRQQAAATLGAGGFDPAKDFLAITVNRWGHGYALPYNTLFEDPNGTPHFEVARKPFGRITIANSDASGVDTIETAFNEAARAVRDLERHNTGRNAVI